MNNSLHRNISRFGMDFELKIWESRSVFFYFRKLNKIVRNGLKSMNLDGGRNSKLKHF
jgi:hypothetical protein